MEEKTETGFKINYSAVKKAVLTCELNKKSEECKKAIKDLGIPIYED